MDPEDQSPLNYSITAFLAGPSMKKKERAPTYISPWKRVPQLFPIA